ncbi:DEAD-domain-containing protein [Tilletiaria anomala UBC 951]|uniref:ATP-dependent RNA helicase n=1 Tax=Tilletiaria anomala (strain ATCC 24038 / CBS 436.72 / UBC 951) TaxID=1037660 RepID=A0A066VVM2_TILAU|nr:DEAD-domain-containing protein [Tilletiaria anomala UBC 951]KDN45772.1 DEAD-domain-containing protein [Tilletiaria anomala UBC 951]
MSFLQRHVRTAIQLAKSKARGRLQPQQGFSSLLPQTRLESARLVTYAARNEKAVTHHASRPAFAHAFIRTFASSSLSYQALEACAEVEAGAPIEVEAHHEPDTSHLFASLKGKLSEPVFRAITQKPFGYKEMSEVQQRVLNLLPEIAESPDAIGLAQDDKKGRDLLVKARTGTGKTLAFLIPAIEARLKAIERVSKGDFPDSWRELLRRNRPELNLDSLEPAELRKISRQFGENTVGTLILSPTRELATQIATEARKLLSHRSDMGVQLLVGGANRSQQVREWRNSRPDIVVATPGRILDLASDVSMVREALKGCQTLVLDEADTLLEMGFRDSITSIIEHLPQAGKERHTMLFSATVSPDIRRIARASLDKNHRFIDCVPAGEENTHKHIPQFVSVLDNPTDQIPYVLSLVAHDQIVNAGKSKVIIFTPTTRMTQLLASLVKSMRRNLPLGSFGCQTYEIHSKKEQSSRFRTSSNFRADKSGGSVLITSDVSARGVDYPGTTRVIQIGVPPNKDGYIHRIGRTGRAGASGRADIVLLPFEEAWVNTQLDDLPIQRLNASSFGKELDAVTAKWEEDPNSFLTEDIKAALRRQPDSRSNRGRGSRRTPAPIGYHDQPKPIVAPLAGRVSLENYRTKVQEAITELDPEDIKETFVSQLGFYLGRVPEMRISKSQVLEEMKSWAVAVGSLTEPPYLSPAFLNKVGLGGSGGGRGGRGGDGRSGFGSRAGGRGGFERGSGGRGGFDRNGRGAFDRDGRSGGYGRSPERWSERDSSRQSSYSDRGSSRASRPQSTYHRLESSPRHGSREHQE